MKIHEAYIYKLCPVKETTRSFCSVLGQLKTTLCSSGTHLVEAGNNAQHTTARYGNTLSPGAKKKGSTNFAKDEGGA